MCPRLIACCVLLCASVVPASAQPLADRVPDDAISYLGWAGTDALGSQYDKSHLKGVVEASSMPQFLNDFLPRVIDRVGGEGPQARELAESAALAAQLCRKPCALAFTGIDLDRPAGKLARTVFVCRAGNNADALLQKIDHWLKIIPGARRDPFGGGTFRVGDLVGFSTGYDNPEAALAPAANRSLAGNAGFKSAMARAGKEPAFVAYIDGERAVGLIGQYVQRGDPRHGAETWTRVGEE